MSGLTLHDRDKQSTAKELKSQTPILSKGFQLAEWQRAAVDAWVRGDPQGTHRGTLEIFTGGGKTLIALACVEHASALDPGLRVAVVVPTEALAHQWRNSFVKFTNVHAPEVGILGAGKSDTLRTHRVLISIINSARKKLPSIASADQQMMLVIDECHRAGSPENAKVLNTPAAYRLGLSATPEREEIDWDTGELLSFDEQVVGQKLGDVVFRFGLKEAREFGWLPDYNIHHHGVSLDTKERRDYEALSRKVDDLAEQLENLGLSKGSFHFHRGRGGEIGKAVNAWSQATIKRKDLLFEAKERHRVAALILERTMRQRRAARILVFNERITAAKQLHAALTAALPDASIELEHSELPARQRNAVLSRFRTGETPVLVSVKALVEGLDVPEIDVALSVASTSSVRQRIQSLGRALRKRFTDDPGPDVRDVHILYVHDSADEEIYGREDWSDLTGKGSNKYLLWKLGVEEPETVGHPPRTPVPSEEQEWERLGQAVPDDPVRWNGPWPDYEYTVDTAGNVTTQGGDIISNPQGVNGLVAKVRQTPAGKFRVTPIHRLVLATGEGDDRKQLFVVGQLKDRFVLVAQPAAIADFEVSALKPGDPYPGPATKENGSFRIGKKRGGVIERKISGGREFALDEGGQPGHENARKLLAIWKELQLDSIKVDVNQLEHAWYLDAGTPRFLAEIKGGLLWPTEGAEGER